MSREVPSGARIALFGLSGYKGEGIPVSFLIGGNPLMGCLPPIYRLGEKYFKKSCKIIWREMKIV